MKNKTLYCRAMSLRGLPELIRELGGSPERLFAKFELNIADIESDNFYNWANACRLLERASLELNEPCLGIKWAHKVPMDFLNSGPLLMLGGLSPTMRDFYDTAIEYQKLHNNGVYYEYVENHAENILENNLHFHPLTPPCRQYSEHIMALLFLTERHHVNKGQFTEVMFQHKAPSDLSWHEKTFKCPISFNSRTTQTICHLDYLTVKLGGQIKALKPMVRLYLNRRIKNNLQYEATMSADIAQILPTLFGSGITSMSKICEALEINPKKLQRLLRDEDITYSQILEDVRKNVAQRLLFESDISITHLAKLLDYSSNQTFNAASKRWFGLSPREYRQQLRKTVA